MNITTMTFAARDFSARPGASDEYTLQGSVRSEQRSLAEKELPPGGLRRIWPVAALLVGHRSTSGYAPSLRLAPGQIRRNERHRSYVHDHLARSHSSSNPIRDAHSTAHLKFIAFELGNPKLLNKLNFNSRNPQLFIHE